MVARFSVEAEYRVMVSATCELIWLKQHIELRFGDVTQMSLICDNQVALHIVSIIMSLVISCYKFDSH